MRKEIGYGKEIFSVIKGVFFALAVSLLSTALFSCVVQVTGLPSKWIYPVNQIIKGLSVVIGVLLSVRGEKGWLKGGGIALCFTALSYLAFSAVGGDFSLSWLIIVEVVVAIGVGGLSGALAVNLPR